MFRIGYVTKFHDRVVEIATLKRYEANVSDLGSSSEQTMKGYCSRRQLYNLFMVACVSNLTLINSTGGKFLCFTSSSM